MHLVVRGRVRGKNATVGNGTRLGGMNGKLIRQIRWESSGFEKLAGWRLTVGVGEITLKEYYMINCMKL